VGRAFGEALARQGIHWLALEDEARRGLALALFRQVPVLWIWDNVEPVAGFGGQPAWSAAEQAALADFLRAAAAMGAKFLLTSRRDERGWLGELPRRVMLPPMPMQERVLLAAGLAARQGRTLGDAAAWLPLLRFTEGNPLTITVVVGQALAGGLRTREEIGAYVGWLRAGEAAFADEASQGRSRSLAGSLAYGFDASFSEAERRQLALLHLFQGFVDVDALRIMGDPEADHCLSDVRGLTREAGNKLLDRAAGIGLLTARGGGCYAIHPALPWFFRGRFDAYYGQPAPAGAAAAAAAPATRAFVEAMAALGNYYHKAYEDGHRAVIAALGAEEANLLHARQLGRRHGWWDAVIGTMQGLRVLYGHTGRRGEWAARVAEIAAEFVDPATGGPRPGREAHWSLVTEYRVGLAREARQWAQAEQWQRAAVAWDRRAAAPALAARGGGEPPFAPTDAAARNAIRTLAVSLHELGEILREQEKAECIQAFEEDYSLSLRIDDRPSAAVTALSLGTAYKDLPALRDLDRAEHWYGRSLELHDAGDRLGRGKCKNQLGAVAYKRFREARAAGRPEAARHHLNDAARRYHEALELLPDDAVADLAVTHNALGAIYGDAGDLDRALLHYGEAIRYLEQQGDGYRAAQTRFNVAVDLRSAGRLGDALEYAGAARRGFEPYGDGAADEIQKTQQLIAAIERAMGGR
jgi:tetratricopeptide (TPR) repeat protein